MLNMQFDQAVVIDTGEMEWEATRPNLKVGYLVSCRSPIHLFILLSDRHQR
jgi:hypothetical protein